jgi:ssDNA-binding Zn-finger/Zn-ribbon topoisomerase 1
VKTKRRGSLIPNNRAHAARVLLTIFWASIDPEYALRPALATRVQQAAAGAGEAVAQGVEETDPETDDGVILDEEEDEAQPDRAPGEWPDEPDDGDDQWKPDTEVDPTPDTEGIEPTGSAVTVPEGEFHCPECEFTTPVSESSLRRGDFCPECHRGALQQRAEDETRKE